jgi:hypothetical protein
MRERERERKNVLFCRDCETPAIKNMKKDIRLIASFIRDFPKLQTKLWASQNKEDAKLAKSLFDKSKRLLAVLATDKPPLGQFVDTAGKNVIGFISLSGEMAAAPMMTIIPSIPIVRANNQTKYTNLLKQSIEFVSEMYQAKKRFGKIK